MNTPEFVEFPKLARLSRECVITEKIDGTGSNNQDEDFLRDERLFRRNQAESDLESEQRMDSERSETWKQEDLEQE